MTYLLDTNAVSDWMKADPRMEIWLSKLAAPDRLVTCAIVRGELLFGIAKLPDGKRRSELEVRSTRFFTAVHCEPVPERAADFYAAVKIARQQRGLTLDENDLWIAATTLALSATLVTRDRDFSEIDGLLVIALL